MENSELRETARWAASVTLLLGKLLADNFDLTGLVKDEYRRRFYFSRLSAETVSLVNEMSNFVLLESVRAIDIRDMATAGQLIDSIALHLEPKAITDHDRLAATLPLQECEPDDTVGAI